MTLIKCTLDVAGSIWGHDLLELLLGQKNVLDRYVDKVKAGVRLL
ncbi:hypothetical protein NST38_30820 [Paenibacillus sp. FSL H8-0104]